jgi:hypothetical protein
MVQYKALDIQAPANGRLKRSTVYTFGDNGEVLFTDKGDLSSAGERQKVSRRIADALELDPAKVAKDLDTHWNDVATQYQKIRERAVTPSAEGQPCGMPGDGPSAGIDPLSAMPVDVVEEAEHLMSDAQLMLQVADDIDMLGVAGERELTITIYLVGISRLLPHPLSAILQGPSSSGKSYLIDKVASPAPSEAVIVATQMTPQALYHMKPGSLCHRWIVGGERSRLENDDRAEATRALREMQSAGKLSKMMPIKMPGGLIETVLVVQEGPIAFIESTTLAKIFEEDANRCLLLNTDERSDQTRRIIQKTASGYQMSSSENLARRRQVHHALQRKLRSYPVQVPFAGRLGELFPADRVEARRAFNQLLTVIQASALLHQRQRQFTQDGCLLANPKDYHLARQLLAKPLSRLLGDAVSDAARRFYDQLAAKWPCSDGAGNSFTVSDARKLGGASKTAIRGWLAELHEIGAVRLGQEGRGRQAAMWQLTETLPGDATFALPPTNVVCDIPSG